MRLCLRFLALCFLCAGAVWVIGLSCSKDKATTPPSGPDWTILVYSDGNNNLDVAQGGNSYCIQDIQDLEKVGSTEKVQIVAMVSSIRTGSIAKYYHVEKYSDDLGDNISSTMLENKGTKDMSDWHTLKDFLVYGVQNYPASRYMLIIDDHGAGWPGSCVDEQNGAGNIMSTVDMCNAIEQSGAGKFEVVAFHACLMSMVEVAYEFRNCANWMLGSEISLPMESVLGADEWLGNLVANPSMSTSTLTSGIVTAVYNAGVAKQKTVHFAAVDLSKISHLAAKVDEFGTQLTTSTGNNWGEVFSEWSQTNTPSVDYPAYVDLHEFAQRISTNSILSQINLIKNAAESVKTAVVAAVPMTMTNAPGAPRSGLTIHLPYQREMYDSTNYARLDFRNVPWTNFVSYFIGMIEQIQQHVTISGTISTELNDMSYPIIALINQQGDFLKVWQLPACNTNSFDYEVTFTVDEAVESYVYAFDDRDNDQTVQESGEPWNCYDANGDYYCEYLTYSDGQTINNVDIHMYPGQRENHPNGPGIAILK